jgi:hypothetical protein
MNMRDYTISVADGTIGVFCDGCKTTTPVFPLAVITSGEDEGTVGPAPTLADVLAAATRHNAGHGHP